MSDRDEIRWKLSNLQRVISSAKEAHEKEQENLANYREDIFSEIIQTRNTFLGGIGFAIVLIISLISINILDKVYVLIIPVGIIIALSIYVGLNIFSNKLLQKYYEMDKEYQNQIIEILDFEGTFTGYSLREDIDNNQIMFWVHFVTFFTQVVAYDIKSKLNEILHTEKPQIMDYTRGYEVVKENIKHLEKYDMLVISRIQNFIQKLESEKLNDANS